MERACARAARSGARIFLYGGRDQAALDDLTAQLRERHPGLQIVGGYKPVYRPLSRGRAARGGRRRSTPRAPDIVWVGLGVPRQEKWMATMRGQLDAPMLVGVGAAFDFLSGTVAQAPPLDPARRPGMALSPDARATPPVAALHRATTRASSSGSRASGGA